MRAGGPGTVRVHHLPRWGHLTLVDGGILLVGERWVLLEANRRLERRNWAVRRQSAAPFRWPWDLAHWHRIWERTYSNGGPPILLVICGLTNHLGVRVDYLGEAVGVYPLGGSWQLLLML